MQEAGSPLAHLKGRAIGQWDKIKYLEVNTQAWHLQDDSPPEEEVDLGCEGQRWMSLLCVFNRPKLGSWP